MSALYVSISIFIAIRKKRFVICLDSACLKTFLEKKMLTLNFVTTPVSVTIVSTASLVVP